MFELSQDMTVYVHRAPVDFRKSVNGLLSALVGKRKSLRCVMKMFVDVTAIYLHRDPVAMKQARRHGHKPATFDFLGFTHYCTKARLHDGFVVGRRTIKKRLRAQLQAIKQELRRRLHHAVPEVGRWLHRVLLGHLNYYAVPGNGASLVEFFREVGKLWIRTLRRRS